MNIITMNILDVTKGLIVHSVNCQSVMGSGVAGQIRKKWPVVYDHYKVWMDEHKSANLGCIQAVRITDDLFVINLAGQLYYGNDGGKYTNYDAIRKGLNTLAARLHKAKEEGVKKDFQVYIPYNMGCGLGGGDFTIVSKIIEEELPNAIICKL